MASWAIAAVLLPLATTVPTAASAAGADRPVAIAGGSFLMGDGNSYAEEGPVRRVTVEPFLISATEVTNAAFRAFVEATGYVTTAERALDPADHPG